MQEKINSEPLKSILRRVNKESKKNDNVNVVESILSNSVLTVFLTSNALVVSNRIFWSLFVIH